jgi:hypothetical protein
MIRRRKSLVAALKTYLAKDSSQRQDIKQSEKLNIVKGLFKIFNQIFGVFKSY